MHHNTPVVTHYANGVEVDVKRDDLWPEPPYPPNAKMRGIRPLLEQLASKGIRHVGVFDTRISEASWGVALESQRLGIACTAYYAQSKFTPRSLEPVQRAGAAVHWVRHNVTPVCYSVAKNHAEQSGIYMLPFGLQTEFAVNAVAKEVEGTIFVEKYNSVVICSGTCTMLAGVARGFRERVSPPVTFYSVSAGAALATQGKRLRVDLIGYLPSVVWIPPVMPYYDECTYLCPFPANKWYDRKAWWWLCEHIGEVKTPILFWNVGAS